MSPRPATRRVAARGLPAKISVPRLTNALPRQRVFGILDRALGRGAVWIVAPAGAGKTTAVGSYLEARGRSVVWYDVDATDTDFANVFVYLASGLHAATRSTRRLPVFRLQHHGSLRAFARTFFESFYAAMPARATLVLDNCHTVAEDANWTQILEEAIRAVPVGRGLVLLSRADPPDGFARQMVSDRLALVTGNELRFTKPEAHQLARARVPRLARQRKGALAEICALADGWAAGLVLVLDHAARGDSTPGPARDHGPLLAYFSAEILGEFAPEAQQQLIAMALLPSMTEKMACAVADNALAGALLHDLHRRGLLVERLDTVSATYRYHPLFRAFLLARASTSAAMLGRAAVVCADSGLYDEAVDLHAQVGAQAAIVALVLSHAPRLVAEGRYQTLGAWLGRLGEAALEAEPWLLLWRAAANIPRDQAASRAQFERAFEGFEARGDAAGLYMSLAGAVQVIFIESDDFRKVDPWFERFTRLCQHGPPPPSEDVEATALTSLLMAVCYARPGLPEAPAWVNRALALAPQDMGTRVRLWSSLVLYLSIMDGFTTAAEVLKRLRAEVGPALDPVTRIMFLEAEGHHFLFSCPRQMLDNVKRGFALARSEGLEIFEGEFLAAAALASALGGDVETSASYLEQAASVGANLPSSHLFRAGIFEYSQGLQRFAASAFGEAARLLALATAASQRTGCRWGEILSRVLRGVALDACGRHEEARLEAASLTRETHVEPMAVPRIGLQLLAAEAALRDGDFVLGRRNLSSALIEAERDGLGYTTFYARGLPHVLANGLRDPAHRPWLSGQIAAQRIRPSSQHLDLDAWPWAVTLRTLGRFELRGLSVSGTRKVQKAPLRLLKCLVAAGSEPLSAAAACEALWDEEAPTAARRMFDTTLHRLRKLVGDDVVQLTDGALTIDRTRCFVDAWAFLSLADRAERRLRQDGAEAAAGQARTLFDEALQLYRGPFLPDEDDVPFVLRYRDRLRGRFVRLVLAFVGTLEPHDWDQAVVLYDRALDADEPAELLTQGLMRGYLARSRSADALKEYHRCQLALHAKGASPSDETRALYDEARGRTHAPQTN